MGGDSGDATNDWVVNQVKQALNLPHGASNVLDAMDVAGDGHMWVMGL